MTEQILHYKATDRQSFIKFIELLREDFLHNRDNWENKSIYEFLEALTRYTEDIQGYYDNTNQNINADIANWQTFADIFKGSVMYE